MPKSVGLFSRNQFSIVVLPAFGEVTICERKAGSKRLWVVAETLTCSIIRFLTGPRNHSPGCGEPECAHVLPSCAPE